ncbi:dTDP-glucose 4,6-dehydratase [Desulfogranum marinum]|uniref:dTDP-glucose 4,6-dehydratase n=1 Tax=Desulfogranum marinum TaxID=453220 RepID=UPI001962DD89|nr:dTDP-glucose 4,6-dehydratase [Desulfogranum marinum]MBM9512537.1 dTDP-glucose 4,6-dehydratase [Desulfogranum marinum]
MKKKVLVTGGCGFIGANFIRLLLTNQPEWQVINLDKLTYAGNLENLEDVADNPRYSFICDDICNQEQMDVLFREHAIDTVVHFAAESHVDRSITNPDAFIQTNVFGTFSLLEAARKAWLISEKKTVSQRRFLHVSTDEVYGSLGETGYFTEETAYDPRSPYSASKASSDHLVRSYYHTYGLPILITNCSNNYGPYQFPEKLIPLILNNALKGESLPVYGDGANIRDWLYVVDHCEAIVRVVEDGTVGQSYNIGGHNEKKNLEVVELLCTILDQKVGLLPSGRPRTKLITFVKDRLGHDRRYAIDANKIADQLGWTPRYTFEQGIEKTVDWYLANKKWMDAVIDGSYQQYYEKMYADR